MIDRLLAKWVRKKHNHYHDHMWRLAYILESVGSQAGSHLIYVPLQKTTESGYASQTPLKTLIRGKDPTYPFETWEEQYKAKDEVHKSRRKKQSDSYCKPNETFTSQCPSMLHDAGSRKR